MEDQTLPHLSLQISRFRDERLVLISDDASGKGTGHKRAVLAAPAQEISTSLVNRIISYSGGLCFVALSPARIQSFQLEKMSRPRLPGSAEDDRRDLDLSVSVEAREGISTGISAADRAKTIAILGESEPNPRKLVKPGHIFPIQARAGGVLVRNALPEAALDFIRLAGFSEAALFVDLLDHSGALMSEHDQALFASTCGIPRVTISDITRHRLDTEQLVTKVAEARLPVRNAGELRTCVYKSTVHTGEHVALVKGDLTGEEPVLTRVQAEFTPADVFGGKHPASRAQLHGAIQAIAARGRGVLIYLRRQSTGELQQQVADPLLASSHNPATMLREYGLGAQILRDLGVKRIELLTGSRKTLSGLTSFGIEIISQRPIPEVVL